MVNRTAPTCHDINLISLQSLLQFIFLILLLKAYFLLVQQGGHLAHVARSQILLVFGHELRNESLDRLMRDDQVRANSLKILTQVGNTFEHESSSVEAALFGTERCHSIVETWIEAKDWQNLSCDFCASCFVLQIRPLDSIHGSLENVVVVDSQIVAEPHNYAVDHFFIVKDVSWVWCEVALFLFVEKYDRSVFGFIQLFHLVD